MEEINVQSTTNTKKALVYVLLLMKTFYFYFKTYISI